MVQSKLSDRRKKTSLKGKVKDVAKRRANALNIPLNSVYVERFLCNDRSLQKKKKKKKIKHLEQCPDEASVVKSEIKGIFASE